MKVYTGKMEPSPESSFWWRSSGEMPATWNSALETISLRMWQMCWRGSSVRLMTPYSWQICTHTGRRLPVSSFSSHVHVFFLFILLFTHLNIRDIKFHCMLSTSLNLQRYLIRRRDWIDIKSSSVVCHESTEPLWLLSSVTSTGLLVQNILFPT